MIEENGTEGFRDCAVSVKILWRDIPESVIVADMPGMKDGDTDSSHFAYCNTFLRGFSLGFLEVHGSVTWVVFAD